MSQAEGFCRGVDEMSSSIGAEFEGAFAAGARRLESFVLRVTSLNRGGLEELLQLALTKDLS